MQDREKGRGSSATDPGPLACDVGKAGGAAPYFANPRFHSSSSSNLRLVRLQPYRFLLATFILLPFLSARESLRGW